MKRKRNRTREALLQRLRELKIAREALRMTMAETDSATANAEYWKQRNFLRGFDWAIQQLKEVA